MSIHRQTDRDSLFGHLNILLQSEGKNSIRQKKLMLLLNTSS